MHVPRCDREGKEQIILTCTNLKFPMKPYWILCIIAIAIIVISSSGCAAQTIESATSGTQTVGGITIPTTTGPPTPTEAQQIAAAAYVYGYPLVLTAITKDQMTAVSSPAPNGPAPINQWPMQFLHQMHRLRPS
jgi:hypothetical protein